MRILYVCQDAGIPVFGRKGASTHIREVIAHLRQRGHDVHLACADLGPDLAADSDLPRTIVPPVTSKKIGADLRRMLSNRLFAKALPQVAATFKPDLIYERHSLYSGAAPKLAKRLGIPHVLEANALLSQELGQRLHWPKWARRVEMKQFRATDHLVTVSVGLRATCESLGIATEKITPLPMAVNPDHFRTRLRSAEMRASLGCDESHLIIGYLGAMAGWHRPELTLQAGANLKEDFPALRLLFVGGSPRHVEELQRLTRELGIEEITHFTGAIPHDEVPALVAEFDIGTVPGAHEWSTPTKIFEYCAMGVACVAPDNGNVRSVLRDGETARLFTPESEESLTDALRDLLSKPDERRAMAQRGREETLAKHTWALHVERLEEIFKTLLT